MNVLRMRLTLLIAVVAIALSALASIGSVQPALAADPVKITIKVTDSGFDPNSIEVPAGSQVELTFVWDSPAHPEDEHIIVIEGYKLESEKINRLNKETVVKFIADKSGSFNFKCDFECDTHDSLQHGTIKVGGGAGGAAGGASAFQPSKLVIDPISGVLVSGNIVSIAANLQDKDGKPIAKAEILFFADRQFLGRHGEVQIAVGKTDASGNVHATYHPTDPAGGKIIARFAGVGLYDKSETTYDLAASGRFQPVPEEATSDDLHGIKGAAPLVLVSLIGSVWLAFAFMLFQAWGISHVRGAK